MIQITGSHLFLFVILLAVGGAALIFDWDRLKELMQHRLLFKAITASHDSKAGRVWNLLIESNKSSENMSPIELFSGKLWDDQQVCL